MDVFTGAITDVTSLVPADITAKPRWPSHNPT